MWRNEKIGTGLDFSFYIFNFSILEHNKREELL